MTFRWCLSDVTVMSLVMSPSCFGFVAVVSQRCFGDVSVMSRCCFGIVGDVLYVSGRSRLRGVLCE